jgi:cytochrome b561
VTEKSPRAKYPATAIAIHWLVLVLVIAVYALILLRENYPRGSDIRETLKSLHYSFGLTVLVLTAVRLALRAFFWSPPTITPPVPPWLAIPAAAAHVALYVLLLAMPVAGWMILSAEGGPIQFFGVNLPALLPPDKELAEQIEEIHETGGTIGYFLIGAHAAAALFHHYLIKDDTLTRMLPRRS